MTHTTQAIRNQIRDNLDFISDDERGNRVVSSYEMRQRLAATTGMLDDLIEEVDPPASGEPSIPELQRMDGKQMAMDLMVASKSFSKDHPNEVAHGLFCQSCGAIAVGKKGLTFNDAHSVLSYGCAGICRPGHHKQIAESSVGLMIVMSLARVGGLTAEAQAIIVSGISDPEAKAEVLRRLEALRSSMDRERREAGENPDKDGER